MNEGKRKTHTSSEVKRRYNQKMYTQLVASVPKAMAAAFKEKCAAEGIPQAQIIKAAIDSFLDGGQKMKMQEDLRRHIGEIYDGGCWQQLTGRYHEGETPWELWLFERDVEYIGSTWRCVIVEKTVFDPDDPEAVDYAEDVFAEAWEL